MQYKLYEIISIEWFNHNFQMKQPENEEEKREKKNTTTNILYLSRTIKQRTINMDAKSSSLF